MKFIPNTLIDTAGVYLARFYEFNPIDRQWLCTAVDTDIMELYMEVIVGL